MKAKWRFKGTEKGGYNIHKYERVAGKSKLAGNPKEVHVPMMEEKAPSVKEMIEKGVLK